MVDFMPPSSNKPSINEFGQVTHGIYTYEDAKKDIAEIDQKKILLTTQTVMATLDARKAEINNNPFVGMNSTKNFAAIGIRYRNPPDPLNNKYKFFTSFSRTNNLSPNHGERLAWDMAERWLEKDKAINVRHIAIHTERSPCNKPRNETSRKEYCAEFFKQKFKEPFLADIPIDLTYTVDRKLDNQPGFKTSEFISLELKDRLNKVGVFVDPPTPQAISTTTTSTDFTTRLQNLEPFYQQQQQLESQNKTKRMIKKNI